MIYNHDPDILSYESGIDVASGKPLVNLVNMSQPLF